MLSTKCGEKYENGRSTHDFSVKALTRSVDQSLKRLQTDYVDLLLLHSDGRDLEIVTASDAIETLTRIKAGGKARAIGISAKSSQGIAAAVPAFDVVMAPFNARDPSLSSALTNAHERKLGILAIKGLFSGYLKASSAIEFVLRQPFVDSLILGTVSKDHLRDAVTTAENVLTGPPPAA